MLIYLLLFVILLLSIMCRKSKTIFWLLLIVMIVIFGFNTHNADFSNYYYLYKIKFNTLEAIYNLSLTAVEPGLLVMYFLSRNILELDYYGFLLIISIIFLIIIGKIILKYGKSPALVLALYFIAPFFPCDVIQIRNFISEVIVIIALMRFLMIKEYKSTDYAIYIGTIIVACFFHVTAIFYILFLMIPLIKNDNSFYFIIISGLALISFIPVLLSNVSFIPEYKIEAYISNSAINSDTRSFGLIFVMIIQLLCAKYMAIKMDKKSDTYEFIHNIYKIHIIMIIVMALVLVYDSSFYRLSRNLLLLDYFALDYYREEKENNKNTLLGIYIVCGILWSTVNVFSQWNVILENNSLIGFLW